MSKHTPGSAEAARIIMGGDKHIDTMHGRKTEAGLADLIAGCTGEDCPIRAAAPELLAAVNMVLDAGEDNGDMDDIDWDMLRTAIAKATGKEARP